MKKTIQTAAAGIAAGFANGLLGTGGGTLLVPSMERFLGVEAHKAHATAIAVMLPLSVVSAFIYVRGESIDITALLALTAGGVAGGIAGAKWMKNIKAKSLQKIFGLFMIAAALGMILW